MAASGRGRLAPVVSAKRATLGLGPRVGARAHWWPAWVGGLVGSLLGSEVVIAVAIGNQWTAVMPGCLIVAGPGIGAVTALVAAVLLALRGANTEPVTALRTGAT